MEAMNSTAIDVITDNLADNPHCFHGPTLLFRKIQGKRKEFYACSACRDRKDCNFYVAAEDMNKKSTVELSNFWQNQQQSAVTSIRKQNPHAKFLNALNSSTDNQNSGTENSERVITDSNFCYTCSCLFMKSEKDSHGDCDVLPNLTRHQLLHPTEILMPKTNSKTHAQYFFCQETVNDILLLLTRLKVSKVLCIGVPRIHESIVHGLKGKIKSLLLDFDKSYVGKQFNFYDKNEFVWFNMFNCYVFDEEQNEVLEKYLSVGKTLVLLDPPFGGRVEPLAYMLKSLSQIYRKRNQLKDEFVVMDTFWFFPYFMEQHITGSLPTFKMFDYKVNYENHSSFTNAGKKKRKFGSPVRIFTNVLLTRLNLTGIDGYKFCDDCRIWVSEENRHCRECRACTSKDGRTYSHCGQCEKCVKPSYEHCYECQRCCLPSHVCGQFQPDLTCYHCHQVGHKKHTCPLLTGKRVKRPKDCDFDGEKRRKKFKSTKN